MCLYDTLRVYDLEHGILERIIIWFYGNWKSRYWRSMSLFGLGLGFDRCIAEDLEKLIDREAL